VNSQRERILAELRRRRRSGEPGLTPLEALQRGLGMRLAARINELRLEGHDIITTKEASHAAYSLADSERRQIELF